MPREWLSPEEWRAAVEGAIEDRTVIDPLQGCHIWSGPMERDWQYPSVRVNERWLNIRQWRGKSRPGHTSFFKPTCGNARCIRMDHLELIQLVPVALVRLMEEQMRAERAA